MCSDFHDRKAFCKISRGIHFHPSSTIFWNPCKSSLHEKYLVGDKSKCTVTLDELWVQQKLSAFTNDNEKGKMSKLGSVSAKKTSLKVDDYSKIRVQWKIKNRILSEMLE